MFTYTLKGKDLTKDEAVALAEATSSIPIKIDLATVLNLRKVDSAKLFKLSVERKSPELANLAYKISVSDAQDAPIATVKQIEVMAIQRPLDQLLDGLHGSNGLWSVGAAMILSAASNGSWWTLRQVASYWVNNLEVSPKSVLFQGFELMNGVWEPRDYRTGVSRRETFHVSPVYIALRDALQWLMKNDLVERRSNISRGSRDENQTAQVKAMLRPFYSMQLNKRGKEMIEMWGDADQFILNSFKTRLR
jgi:hypothetical protein